MKELNDRSRALLRATQFTDDPSDEDYDRVHAAVAARIATAVAVGAAATVGAKAATAATTATASAATTAAVGASTLASASIAPAAGIAGAALPALKIAAWVVALSMTAGVGSAVVVKQTHTQSVQRPVAAILAPPAPVNPPPRSLVAVAATPASHVMETLPVVVNAPAPSPVVAPAAPARQVVVPLASLSVPASSLEAEVALLRDARAALHASDSARTLALLDEHARRFPNGSMVQDRDALQVFATCAAGQDDAARELASVFLSRHPGSSYDSAVRASCSAKK